MSASLCIGVQVTRDFCARQPFKPLTVNRESQEKGLGGTLGSCKGR